MKQLPPINKLKKVYHLTTLELLKVLHKCVHYYLSEEEFQKFANELYIKRETKINKNLQV